MRAEGRQPDNLAQKKIPGAFLLLPGLVFELLLFIRRWR